MYVSLDQRSLILFGLKGKVFILSRGMKVCLQHTLNENKEGTLDFLELSYGPIIMVVNLLS